jgi:hypothetical protein
MFDGQQIGETIVAQVKGFMEREIAPLKAANEALTARIVELEARPPAEKGEPGEPGKDAEAPTLASIVDEVRPVAEEIIREVVAGAVAALPPPERGEKGETGDRGDSGERGLDGRDGLNGVDGRGVKELLIDRDGNLVATMDDGEMKSLGPVVGKDGKKGSDGADGFGLDDFDIEPGEDGRTYVLKFQRGDVVHKFELTFPCPVYCGVWNEKDQFTPGDMVTWGGSTWHCNRANPGKPDTKDSGWQLMVKKGRDGKDAK